MDSAHHPQRPPVDLLQSFDSALMKIWRVKSDVDNTQNNRPDLIDPYNPPNEPDEPPKLF
jgi:tRNA G37 N-methylase TrmD